MANILKERVEFFGAFFPADLIYTLRLRAIKERESVSKTARKVFEDWQTLSECRNSNLLAGISNCLVETWSVNELDKDELVPFKRKIREELLRKKLQGKDIQWILKDFESKVTQKQ